MQMLNYQAALKDFDKVLTISPDNSGAFLGKAEVLERLEKYDEAWEIYNGLIKYSKEINAYLGRARGYYRRGDYQSAIRDFEEYLSRKPTSTQALLGVADCYLMMYQLDLSKKYYSVYISISTHFRKFYTMIQTIYLPMRGYL